VDVVEFAPRQASRVRGSIYGNSVPVVVLSCFASAMHIVAAFLSSLWFHWGTG